MTAPRIPPMKPEPSRATLGRAKAKGTGLAYVSPDLSRAYLLAKAGQVDLSGLPTAVQQPADDAAAPLSAALAQWVYTRLHPNPILSGLTIPRQP